MVVISPIDAIESRVANLLRSEVRVNLKMSEIMSFMIEGFVTAEVACCGHEQYNEIGVSKSGRLIVVKILHPLNAEVFQHQVTLCPQMIM
uniref:Uncharacterized protein n=1 Tax=Helianthus annuus TaxID=4232 RepID=A0A251VQ50_HELAN